MKPAVDPDKLFNKVKGIVPSLLTEQATHRGFDDISKVELEWHLTNFQKLKDQVKPIKKKTEFQAEPEKVQKGSSIGEITVGQKEINLMLSAQIMTCVWKECNSFTTMDKPYMRCGKCGTAYCCREHQVLDWKDGHKNTCSTATSYKPRSDDTVRREVVTEVSKVCSDQISALFNACQKLHGKGCISLHAVDFMNWTQARGAPSCQIFVQYYTTDELSKTQNAYLKSLHNLSVLVSKAKSDSLVLAAHDDTGYCLALEMTLSKPSPMEEECTNNAAMFVTDTMTLEFCFILLKNK